MAATALRAPLALPPCPGCRGGGEVNGVTCRECGGTARARGRARWSWRRLAGRLATPVGTLVGTALNWSRTLPGVGGASAVSYGLAAVAHGLVPRIPELGAAALAAGVFGLLADRRL